MKRAKLAAMIAAVLGLVTAAAGIIGSFIIYRQTVRATAHAVALGAAILCLIPVLRQLLKNKPDIRSTEKVKTLLGIAAGAGAFIGAGINMLAANSAALGEYMAGFAAMLGVDTAVLARELSRAGMAACATGGMLLICIKIIYDGLDG